MNNILHLYRCLSKWMSWAMLLSPITSWISMRINENCIVKYWSGYLNRWDLFLFKYISKKLVGESISKTCRQDPTPRPKRQDILEVQVLSGTVSFGLGSKKCAGTVQSNYSGFSICLVKSITKIIAGGTSCLISLILTLHEVLESRTMLSYYPQVRNFFFWNEMWINLKNRDSLSTLCFAKAVSVHYIDLGH